MLLLTIILARTNTPQMFCLSTDSRKDRESLASRHFHFLFHFIFLFVRCVFIRITLTRHGLFMEVGVSAFSDVMGILMWMKIILKYLIYLSVCTCKIYVHTFCISYVTMFVIVFINNFYNCYLVIISS